MSRFLLAFICLLSVKVFSAPGEYVEKIYSCGDDVGIYIANVGWVVAREADLGEKRVDRILSMALTLYSAQKPVGYYNLMDPVHWCGIDNVRPFTAFMAKGE